MTVVIEWEQSLNRYGFPPTQVELLAPDEKEKVLQKREKNKAAAERCRIKRRENVQKTRTEYEDYLEANETLESDIQTLKEEVKMLQDILNNHHCVLKSQAQHCEQSKIQEFSFLSLQKPPSQTCSSDK